MSKTKITPAQIWIIGAVLIVIAAVTIYFALIKPTNEAIQAAADRISAAQTIIDKQPQALKDQEKAKQEVAEAKAKWSIYDREYMYTRYNGHVQPIVDISNLLTGMRELWYEQIKVLQPKVQNFLLADKTVQVVSSSLKVAAPPSDPNSIARKAFVFDLGSVTVVGSFNDVLNNAERWNKFDRLMLVDGLSLQGNSPKLAGTYTLRCIELTHGEKPAETIPQASGNQGGFGVGPGGADMGLSDVPPPGGP